MRKPSSESSGSKMASAQVVETSVTNNSPSRDSNHPYDLFQSRYLTPGFKPFSYRISCSICVNHHLVNSLEMQIIDGLSVKLSHVFGVKLPS